MLVARLLQFRQAPAARSLVRATVSAGAGFCVRVRGELPWPHLTHLAAGSLLGGRPLNIAGLEITGEPGDLRVRTTTPESILRLTACLARREPLVLRQQGATPGRVVVSLRDFEGDEAVLPALVSYTSAETWLQGATVPPLELEDDERLALARWAYPPESWLTPELLEKLL
jgi:hypothetical protein